MTKPDLTAIDELIALGEYVTNDKISYDSPDFYDEEEFLDPCYNAELFNFFLTSINNRQSIKEMRAYSDELEGENKRLREALEEMVSIYKIVIAHHKINGIQPELEYAEQVLKGENDDTE